LAGLRPDQGIAKIKAKYKTAKTDYHRISSVRLNRYSGVSISSVSFT